MRVFEKNGSLTRSDGRAWPSPRTAVQLLCNPTLCGNAAAQGKSPILRSSCRNSTSSRVPATNLRWRLGSVRWRRVGDSGRDGRSYRTEIFDHRAKSQANERSALSCGGGVILATAIRHRLSATGLVERVIDRAAELLEELQCGDSHLRKEGIDVTGNEEADLHGLVPSRTHANQLGKVGRRAFMFGGRPALIPISARQSVRCQSAALQSPIGRGRWTPCGTRNSSHHGQATNTSMGKG